MSTTQWIPRMQTGQRQWLLADGQIVTEPALEETTSGRKIRVAAAPHLSAFSRDFDNLMKQSVRETASQQGTVPWLRLATRSDYTPGVGIYPDPSAKPSLHLLETTKQRGQYTNLWWRFKHATLPIEGYLRVQVMDATPYGHNNGARPNDISVKVVAPDTRPNYFDRVVIHQADSLEQLVPDASYQVTETLRTVIAAEGDDLWTKHVTLGEQKATSERDAAVRLLKIVHQAEELASIKIPDMRDPLRVKMLELEVVDTNVTPMFLDDLKEYLDGAPTVEEAALHYGRTLEALRNAGMVLESKSSNEFLSALISGDKGAISVTVTAQAPEAERDHNGSYHGDSIDHDHRVTLHLATGTVAVECNFRGKAQDAGKIADAWEESLVRAQLTGQEDVLLAYAKKYVDDAEKIRTKRILDERKHPA